MDKKKEFEAIREIRGRLEAANDDAILKLSARAMPHIKNVLKTGGKNSQTAAYHSIAQKYERLESALERMNEASRFLGKSSGEIKRAWQEIKAEDAEKARDALFSLLSGCEALDAEDVPARVKSESKNIDKIIGEIEKIKKKDQKSCEAAAKLSGELERSLRNLDNIIGGTSYPGENFDEYSKFSEAIEALGEQNRRLNESMTFSGDDYTKDDWAYFMPLDMERTKESIKKARDASTGPTKAMAE